MSGMGAASDLGLGLAVVFNVTGSGEASLTHISREMENIASKAAAASLAMSGGAGGKAGLSSSIGASEAGLVALEAAAQRADIAFQGITAAGSTLIDFGASIIGAFGSATTIMLDQLGEVEVSLVRIMSLGNMSREAAMQTAERTLDLATALPGSIRDMTSLTSNLMEAGINVNKVYGTYESIAKSIGNVNAEVLAMTANLSKESQKQVTAASAVVDMAAAMGETGSRFKMFQQLMTGFLSTGNVQRIRNRISLEAREAILEAGKSGGGWDTQKATQGMIDYLTKTGKIGTGVLMSASWEGIKEKFSDMPTFFARMIGGMPGSGGPFDQLVKQIYGVQVEILNAFEDPKFQESLRGAMKPILDVMIGALKHVGNAIRGVFDFIKDHPGVVKAVLVFTALAGVVSLAAGAFLVLTGVVGSFVAATVLMLAALGPGLLATLPVVIGLMAGLALAIGAVAVGYTLFQRNFGGVKDFFLDLVTLGQAAFEMIQNLGIAGKNTSAISQESFAALNARGLMPFFRNLQMWVPRILGFWDELKAKMTEAWDSDFAPKLLESFSKLSDAAGNIVSSIVIIATALGLISPAADTSIGEAERKASSLADSLVLVSSKVVAVTGHMTTWFSTIVGSGPDAAEKIMLIALALGLVKNSVEIVMGVFVTLAGVIMIALSPVVALWAEIINGMKRFSEIAAQVASGDFMGALKTAGTLASETPGLMWDALSGTAGAGWALTKGGASSVVTDVTDIGKTASRYNTVSDYAERVREDPSLAPRGVFQSLGMAMPVPSAYPATWEADAAGPYSIGQTPNSMQSVDARGYAQPIIPESFKRYMETTEGKGNSEERLAAALSQAIRDAMPTQLDGGQSKAPGPINVQVSMDSRVVGEVMVNYLEELGVASNGLLPSPMSRR